MLPEINIGPLTLQTFGLCVALGFVAAGALVGRRFRELGKPVDWAYEMSLAAARRWPDRLTPLLRDRELERRE